MKLALAITVLLALQPPPSEGPRRTAPVSSLHEYFTHDDYPIGALKRGAEGTVRFLLEIGGDGAIRKCRIEASSGVAELDRATCDILYARARFRPAADREGRPVPDRWRSSVTWRIAEDRPPTDRPYRLIMTVVRDAGGEISCGIELDGRTLDHPFGRRCDFPDAAAAIDSVQGRHRRVRFARVVAMRPAGSPAPHDGDGVEGTLLYEWEGRLSIAPDGRVAECRSTLAVRHPGRFGWVGPAMPCEIYARGIPFRPSPPGTEIRFVHVRHALYRQTGD